MKRLARPAALLAALLSWAACGRKAPAAPGAVTYEAPGGRFTVTLPADWRVDETPGEDRLAAFFGPGVGAQAEMITVSFFGAGSRWKSPREYISWRATAGRAEGPVAADGSGAVRVAVRLKREAPHLGAVEQRLRVAAIPAGSGFLAVEDYTPAERDGDSLDAFLTSLRPGKT